MTFLPRRRRVSLLIATLLVTVRAPAATAPAEGSRGMVASSHVLASEIGAEVLAQGGNAVDAAVATGLALAVVYPQAGNLGGGGFMLVHLAGGRQVVIDYRETAPRAATADMYLDEDGDVRRGAGSSTLGWRASGVPGTVAGLAYAFDNYGSGRVSWSTLVEPARRLAAEGHVVSSATAAHLRAHTRLLGLEPETRRIFLDDGKFRQAGDRWLQPELASTLERVQREGAAGFYHGETARLIATAMEKNGGTLTAADLAEYRVRERVPLRGSYRGYDIVTMPPPSSGGIALLQMLAMLEPHNVRALGAVSADRYHLFTEVMRRAFRVRAEFLGDPDFVSVPVQALLSPAYPARLMQDFDPARATPSDQIGAPTPILAEALETTHFSIVDAAGNAVANTYTLNGNYGSGVTIPGTGVLMNNEMDDFTSKVGVRNMFGLLQGEANAIAPGKRPLSSMTPTLVFKDGQLLLATGSPGGPTIINTVLQVLTHMIDLEMPLKDAVAAPRIHHQWMPDALTYEQNGLPEEIAAELRSRGHTVKARESYEGATQGAANSVGIDPITGRRIGVGDPRRGDSGAVGVE